MEIFKEAFNSVGWFIPPYVAFGFLSPMVVEIQHSKGAFTQSDLEAYLAQIHVPEHLAAMVMERYPVTPCVQEYQATIAESVEAHVLGLHHVAVAGLLPVIEGAATLLARSRNLPVDDLSTKGLFLSLTTACKEEVLAKRIGAVQEVIPMLDAFLHYAQNHLYVRSDRYPLPDKTNRHGILHGAYSDDDYGQPINFYKVVSLLDMLCFISAIRASISWFAPAPTERSRAMAIYYTRCAELASTRPMRARGAT